MKNSNGYYILKDKLEKTKTKNESKLHLDMKLWIATKFYNDGVHVDDIEFEKKIKGEGYYYTVPDVFIHKKDIAIYCQTNIRCPWIYDFMDSRFGILKKNHCSIIIVVPCNLNGSFICDDLDDLKENGIDILRSPHERKIESRTFSIYLDGSNINQLIKLQRNTTFTSMNEFIENIVKSYIKKTKINGKQKVHKIDDWL